MTVLAGGPSLSRVTTSKVASLKQRVHHRRDADHPPFRVTAQMVRSMSYSPNGSAVILEIDLPEGVQWPHTSATTKPVIDPHDARTYEQGMLTSAEVAAVLGRKSNNRQAATDLWTRGDIVRLPKGRSFVYPAFQFDQLTRRVIPVVAEVNRLLNAKDDPLGVGSWWVTPHSMLGGKSPKDMVGTEAEEDLLQLAKDVVEPQW